MKTSQPDPADTESVTRHLHFSPDAGHVNLFDQRMLLMHADSVAMLRQELIASLGEADASSLLTRVGYQQGFSDGQRVRQLGIEDPVQALSMGPRLRELEGFVRNKPIESMLMDMERGEFKGDYVWDSSWEAQAHLKNHGISGKPVCWIMGGYADGYCTAVTGIPVHWKEVECVGMGHSRCRVIGRPLADWEEDGDDSANYLKIDSFVGAQELGYDAPSYESETDFEGFVGISAGFNRVAHLVRKVAPTDSTVLFRGESGVGKDCFTRALHSISDRAGGPLIAVNCAAIPADLVEAELFGVVKGAFTGAEQSRPGRFERANGGTLFLDEITSLPAAAQGKVLRALQEGEIERVGGTEVHRVDVRVVAAANRDLRDEVREGRFREDLFYRLNVFPIVIPPLRERREDIPLLVALFFKKNVNRMSKAIAGLTPRAHSALLDYDWPGNVRELENMIERGIILVDPNDSVDVHHLFAGGEQTSMISYDLGGEGDLVPSAASTNPDSNTGNQLADELLDKFPNYEQLERMVLEQALNRAKGNVSGAARLMGLRRGQMEYRLKKHGIQDQALD